MSLIGTELARSRAQNPSGALSDGASLVVRRNLADNPNVETDGVGYFAIAGTGGAATAAKSSLGGLAYYGLAHARVAWTTATTAVSGGVEYRNRAGTGIPVAAGLPYSVGWFVYAPKAQRLQLQLEWRNAADAVVSTGSATPVVVPASQWTRLQLAATAPATATKLRVRAVAVAGTGGVNWASGDWLAADALLVEQTTRLLDYFDSLYYYYGSAAVAGDGTIELRDAEATVRTNMCMNPSAEVDTSYVLARGTGSVLTTDTTRAVQGLRSFKVAFGVAGQPRSYLWQAFLDSAAPGETFTFSAYVWSANARTAQGVYELVDLAGGAPTGLGAVHDLAAGQWTRVSDTYTVPAGGLPVKGVTFGLSTDLGAANEFLWIDGVLIERGATLRPFFDGSTPTDGAEYHSWAKHPTLGADPGRIWSRRVASRPLGYYSDSGAEFYRYAGGGIGVVGSVAQATAAESGVHSFAASDYTGQPGTIIAQVRAIDACTLELCNDASPAATKTLAAGETTELRSIQASVAAQAGLDPWWIPAVQQKDAAPKNWVVLGFAAVVGDDYTGPQFDGSTPPPGPDSRYVWLGAPNSSDSVWEYLPSPALTATPDQSTRSVELLAEGIASVEMISVRRITSGYETKLVRSARAAEAVGGVLFAFDHEPPLGLTSQYQAMAHYPDGSISGWSDPISVAIGCDENEVWVKDPGQPLRSMRLILRELGDRVREDRSERHDVQGAGPPVVISDVRSGAQETVVFGTRTHAEKDQLDALLDTGQVLLVQTPPGWGRRDAFSAFGRSREVRLRQYGPVQHRNWEVELTEVAEPTGDRTGLPSNSYAVVLATFATYADLLAARPTYLSVLAGTAAVQ